MLQKKYVVLAGVVVVVIGLAGGSFVLWHKLPKDSNLRPGLGASSQFITSGTTNSSAYANGQNIPLTPVTSGSSGLNADSSPSSGNLGQLSVGQNSSGSNGNSSAQGASSGSSSSNASSSAINPSTFSQYEKYSGIDPTTGQPYAGALFGDVQVGTGTALTTSGQKASVYYKGWLTNGTLFDESRADSSGQLQPFTFTLGANQVIACWEEGVAGMKVGGTRLLVCPPSVGYGAAGQPPSIPGNAVLVFEVQLLAAQ